LSPKKERNNLIFRGLASLRHGTAFEQRSVKYLPVRVEDNCIKNRA